MWLVQTVTVISSTYTQYTLAYKWIKNNLNKYFNSYFCRIIGGLMGGGTHSLSLSSVSVSFMEIRVTCTSALFSSGDTFSSTRMWWAKRKQTSLGFLCSYARLKIAQEYTTLTKEKIYMDTV